MTQWFIKDSHPETMAPLSDLRATFEQRTGGFTTLERLTKQFGTPPSGFICDCDQRSAMITQRTGLTRVTDEQETATSHPSITTPWEILDHLPTLLADDLEQSVLLDGVFDASRFGDHRIDIHPLATLFPGVVLDASLGPIRIEEYAVIRPNVVLCGPCWIGKESTIIDGALIKSNTSIGPSCKIGGEVGGTIFQGYSNKSHDGHLGDSVIGEWVNFGAGTTNSNLLNTYGEVVVLDLEGYRHRTGRQFVGCFVGDHVKFSICTKIITGSMIGTGAMIATSVPATSPTPRFAWLTDGGSRIYRLEKFLKVARVVMSRRGAELHPTTEVVLRKLAVE